MIRVCQVKGSEVYKILIYWTMAVEFKSIFSFGEFNDLDRFHSHGRPVGSGFQCARFIRFVNAGSGSLANILRHDKKSF